MVGLKLRLIREWNRSYSMLLKLTWFIQGHDSPRVYLFHSIVDSHEYVYSKFALTSTSFRDFLQYELSRGQIPMNLYDLKRAIQEPYKFKNRFAVSFDDIYDSVYTNAYPILKRLNIPFIIFVTPELFGKIDPASKNIMITKEHLIELMQDELCIIGSHGMEHRPFRFYSDTDALKSMIDSKVILGKETELFAFPYGRRIEVSCKNIKCAPKAGYYCAFSAIDGSLMQKWISGRWFLPRVLVDEEYVKKHIR